MSWIYFNSVWYTWESAEAGEEGWGIEYWEGEEEIDQD